MKNKYTFTVVIGRFQIFHNGHLFLIEQALEKTANKVIILVGCLQGAPNHKNPFTFEERKQMISEALLGKGYRKNQFEIIGIQDHLYSENTWIAEVQSAVMQVTKGNHDIALVGHDKDATSYYLRSFPEWQFINVPALKRGSVDKPLDATFLREALFTSIQNLALLEANVPFSTYKIVKDLLTVEGKDWFNDRGAKLKGEWFYITEYKKSWENVPYPVNFVTVDAVVVRSGHVLLIQRGENPGLGNWALPGGFLNVNETIEKAVIRELKEETGLGSVNAVHVEEYIKGFKVFDHPNRSLRGRVITHAFLIDLGNGVLPVIRGGDDASNAAWKPISWIFQNLDKMHEDHAAIIESMVLNNG